MKTAKPFIKWVGGKSQLLEQIEGFFPNKLKKEQVKHYVEPFLGIYIHSENNIKERRK